MSTTRLPTDAEMASRCLCRCPIPNGAPANECADCRRLIRPEGE